MRKYFRGRSFGYILRFVLATPLALVFWLCIEFINVFRPVYLISLSYKGRIFQYITPMELHLRQANQASKKYLMIFVMPAATPNEAVRTIYRRYALIIDSHFPKIIRSAFGILSEILNGRYTPVSLEYQLVWSLPPATVLNKSEYKYGESLMRQLGIPESSQFVCIGVKDGAYYASVTKNAGYGQDLSHQANDFRNIDITDFMLAANNLAKLGIYVVRVGSVVGAPLPKNRHELIIDYAYESRSELGDVVLGAGCKFFICGSTGSFLFAANQNRPIIYCNHYFENSNTSSRLRLDQLPNSSLIPRLFKTNNDSLLKFQTIISENRNLLTHEALKSLKLTQILNSPSEISAAILEFNALIDNGPIISNNFEDLQDSFYSCFDPPFPWRLYNMRISPSFLRKYQDLL